MPQSKSPPALLYGPYRPPRGVRPGELDPEYSDRFADFSKAIAVKESDLMTYIDDARRISVARLASDAERAATLLERQLATFGHAMAPEMRTEVEASIRALRWSASDCRMMNV